MDEDAHEALAIWLLTEDAYARGGVADEVLTYMQDHVGRLLGPHAIGVAGEFLRERAGPGRDLAALACDRHAVSDLLARIEGRRRRGFELEWRAFPPEPPGRPEALLVMAEYHCGDPVWDRPRGTGDPVSLSELGVSDPLVQRLRAWNEMSGQPGRDGSAWVRDGLALAHELQEELPDVDVRYYHADDDRPLRSL